MVVSIANPLKTGTSTYSILLCVHDPHTPISKEGTFLQEIFLEEMQILKKYILGKTQCCVIRHEGSS